jgi:PAS domain S-box-containing protein
MKILYVEDEIAHVELTRRTLEDNLQESFVLYHAESLQDAVKILGSEPDIDLVLTDLRLPDGSGLDLLKRVKELPVPPAVVLVTGQGDEQVAVTALKAGAADYLVKEGNYLNRLPPAINNAVAQNQLVRKQAALRAAEYRFRVLVEQLPAAVYTSDHDEFSSAQYISPQIKEISGFSAEEWLADPKFWLERLHPDDLELVLKTIKSTYESLSDFNMEYRIIHRDGSIVWVRDVAKSIVDDQGIPQYWQGILFNITSEVEAQATLRASEERFRRIFHSTPIATCVVTMDDGRFIDANQAFQNLVGVPLDNLVGHTSLELGFWQKDQDREDFISDLKKQGIIQGAEVHYQNVPDGPRDTLGFYEPIELEGNTCLLAMFYDVTDQKKAQKALQAERDFALQVLNNMGQGLTIINQNSQLEYVNPAFANMIGYTIDNILGKKPVDFTPASDQAALEEERNKRQQGLSSTYETKISHNDGHEVPVIVTSVPRQKNGELDGAIAVITDLTIQKQTEQALERQINELTALHAVATAEAESFSEDEIIGKVTLIISQIYSEVCGILLLDRTGTLLTPHPSYVGADISNWQKGYPISEGITGRSVSTGKIIRTGNITNEPGYIEIAAGVMSELCMPIRVHERVIGAINVESRLANFFTEHDENFLITVASGLGTSLERLRLFDEEQKRSKELNTLYMATKSLAESLELTTIAERLIVIINELLGYESASIHVVDDHSQFLIALAISRKSQDRNNYNIDIEQLIFKPRPMGIGIIDWVVQNGTSVRTGDASKDPRYREIVKGVQSELCVPLIARGRVIGAINLESIEPNAYTEEDENLISALANSAAIAIENAQLYETESKSREKAELLRNATATLTTSIEPGSLYGIILDALRQLVPYDSASIEILDEGYWEIVAEHDLPSGYQFIGKRYQSRNENLSEFESKREPVIIHDVQLDESFTKLLGTEYIRGWMGVPMFVHNRLIGYLNLDSRKPNFYTKDHAALAQTFGNQAAIALENARLFEAEKKRRQEAETLRQAATAISSTLDPDAVVTEILAALKQVIPYDSGSVFFQEGNQLRLAMAKGFANLEHLKNLRFPADDEIFQIIKSTGHPFILNDVLNDPRFKKWGDAENIRGWMAVPLIARGSVIGCITLDSHQANAYDDGIGETAMAFAHQAAAAIDNARLYDETQRRLGELEIINHVSTSLRLAQSVDEILSILLDEAVLLVNTQHGSIWLYDHVNEVLTQRVMRGAGTNLEIKSLKPGEGIVGQVFLSGEKYIMPENKVGMAPDLIGICIPIKSTVGSMGVLFVAFETERQITGEINLLTILAEITGNAIHRAELFEQSQEQIRKLITLRDIDSAIASSTDLRVTLNILMDHTLKHLKTDAIDIMLYHPELQSLTYLCSSGFNNPAPSRPLMRLGEGLAGQVVMKGGIEQVTDLRTSNEVRRDPMLAREGFVTYFGIPLIVKGQIKGVFEIFHRSTLTPTAEWMQFLQTLAGQAAIAIDNAQLFEHLQRSNQEVTQAYDTTLEGWARALELRDRETEGHTRRVTELTMQLAHYIGIADDELVNIYRGVLLHDIGKMGVPDQILRKTGPLIETEWIEMRKHPEYAFNLLAPIPYLRPALDIPYCHHEHWDGSGYPRGLKGEQIPLSARIFSIVDIWDALLSDRSYRKAWPEEKVLEYVKEISGSILDPKVVTVFLQMMGKK